MSAIDWSEFMRGVAMEGVQVGLVFAAGVIASRGSHVWKRLYRRVRLRKPVTLLYSDCGIHAQTLAERLGAVRLGNAEELAGWPLRPKSVRAVLLLITDVTQLSANKRLLERIEGRLKTFCDAGGILILGHDAIYRRFRAETLREMAGGKLSGFKGYDGRDGGPATKVVYELCTPSPLPGLPTKVELSDNEVLRGDWDDSVQVLYKSADAGDPLVTQRSYGKGRVHWVNSGDHTRRGPPPSIAGPDEGLVEIMSVLLSKPG